MARKDAIKPVAQEMVEPRFEPYQLDKHATVMKPGWVHIDGIEELVPLSSYQESKEQELANLKNQESLLYKQVKEQIRQYLPSRNRMWQEECRGLSWAYSANGNLNLLKKAVEVYPSMALLRPSESAVAAHHMSHLIRAFLATIEKLEPLQKGTAPCIVYIAEEDEDALQGRILVWKYLLGLRSPEDKERLPVKSLSITTQILEIQQTILEKLTLIEEMLCKQQTSKRK